MRTGAIAGLVLCWAMAAGAQGGGQPAGGMKAKSTASGDAAISELVDTYVKAVLAGDAKTVASLYTEDAVEMPPNEPSIKGRAAIEQYYARLFSGPVKVGQFTVAHLETRTTGDTGYDVGTYRQTINPPPQTAANTETGKYLIILKRSQGAWKVAYAIYNSDQAPPRR